MPGSGKPLIYLDTNVFIAAFEADDAASGHAWRLLDAVESAEIEAVTSELTLAEVLVKPIERGDAELAETYRKVLPARLGFLAAPVSRDVLEYAAAIRARMPAIRLPDAVHLATADLRRCSILVSSDRRLTVSRPMRRVDLGPNALDHILAEE